jgi:hypothetical protein
MGFGTMPIVRNSIELENITFRKLDMFPSLEYARGHLLCWVQLLRLALSKGPNRVSFFLSSPEDGNRSSLRNIVFSGSLEFRTMDKVPKPSDSERHTAALQPLDVTGTSLAHSNGSSAYYTRTSDA